MPVADVITSVANESIISFIHSLLASIYEPQVILSMRSIASEVHVHCLFRN